MSCRLCSLLIAAIVLTGCNSQQQREAHYLERGGKYFDKGDFQKARLEYRNAARIAPVDPEPAYRLGLADEALLNIGAAYGDFMHAAELDKTYQPALLKLASYDLAAGQADEAARNVDAVLALAPDEAEGRALQAALFLRKADYAAAENGARFALSKDPANITAYSVLTGLYLATGEKGKAAATIAEGVAKNPADISLLLLQAKVAEDKGDYTAVDAAYQRMFVLKPDFPQLQLDLANLYIAAKLLDDAERTLRAAVAAKPDDMNFRHVLVKFLGDHRSLESAEAEIHADMTAYPKKDDFYFWLADLYTAHNADDKAVTLLQQVVAENKSSDVGLNARTSLARIDFIRGNRDLAQQLVDTVLARQPSNHSALFVRANLAFERGDYQIAASDLRSITTDHPDDAAAKKLLAETFLRQGYLNLAIETLSQLATANPGDLTGRVRLAQLYSIQKNDARALEIVNAVVKEDPSYEVAWETIARIAIDAGDAAGAKGAIKNVNAREDGPHLTEDFLNGQLAAKQGDTQGAIDLYKKVIAADATTPLAAHSNDALIALYMQQGKADEAVATLDKAMEAQPDDPQPYLDRAQLYLESHQPDQALTILDKAEKANPGDLRATMMRADIANGLGHYREATQLYETILARSPGMDVAANNLAAMIADYQYSDAAALDKAYGLAHKFSTATQPELLDTLAWVCYRQNNIDQALAIFTRAAKLSPALSPEMNYHYGAILLKAGKTSDARTHLQQAVAGDASYPGRDDARALLTKL